MKAMQLFREFSLRVIKRHVTLSLRSVFVGKVLRRLVKMSRSGYHRDATHLVDLANHLFFKEFKDRDFTFVLDGERVKVHKTIIKVTSEKFGKLFDEWAKEGVTSVSVETTAIGGDPIGLKTFKLFIQFCYTGSLNWKETDDIIVLELLALCHEYGYSEFASVLGDAVKSKGFMNIWNVWYFFEASNTYQLQALRDTCIRFIDRHAMEALNEERMVAIDATALKNVLCRNTLFAKEVEILKTIINYLTVNKSTGDIPKTLLDTIRWSLITQREFTEIVLPTGLVDEKFYEERKGKKEEERYDPDNPPSRY